MVSIPNTYTKEILKLFRQTSSSHILKIFFSFHSGHHQLIVIQYTFCLLNICGTKAWQASFRIKNKSISLIKYKIGFFFLCKLLFQNSFRQ